MSKSNKKYQKIPSKELKAFFLNFSKFLPLLTFLSLLLSMSLLFSYFLEIKYIPMQNYANLSHVLILLLTLSLLFFTYIALPFLTLHFGASIFFNEDPLITDLKFPEMKWWKRLPFSILSFSFFILFVILFFTKLKCKDLSIEAVFLFSGIGSFLVGYLGIIKIYFPRKISWKLLGKVTAILFTTGISTITSFIVVYFLYGNDFTTINAILIPVIINISGIVLLNTFSSIKKQNHLIWITFITLTAPFVILSVSGRYSILYEYPLKTYKLAKCKMKLELHSNSNFYKDIKDKNYDLIWRGGSSFLITDIKISKISATNIQTNIVYLEIPIEDVKSYSFDNFKL